MGGQEEVQNEFRIHSSRTKKKREPTEQNQDHTHPTTQRIQIMKSVFPKPRPKFCKTADGKQIYFNWRHCGKIVLCLYFALNKIQLDESTDDMFNIQDLMGLDSNYIPSFAECAEYLGQIHSDEINRLVKS